MCRQVADMVQGGAHTRPEGLRRLQQLLHRPPLLKAPRLFLCSVSRPHVRLNQTPGAAACQAIILDVFDVSSLKNVT